MTTVVSRLYPDAATAEGVRADLLSAGFPAKLIDVIADGGTGLADRVAATLVSPEAAARYAKAYKAGQAILVVRAPFNPIGAARVAIALADKPGSVDIGLATNNEYRREQSTRETYSKVLSSHRRMLTSDIRPGDLLRRGPVSPSFGMPLLSSRKPSAGAILRSGPLLSGVLPSLSRRKPSAGTVLSGGPVFSKLLGWPLLASRG